jgi:DNA-binding NarL/FixJ family response regulator
MSTVGGSNDVVAQRTTRVLIAYHNAFREALAMRLDQEEGLEVAWQADSIAEARDMHLDGIALALVAPSLPDGDGLEIVRQVSVANPNASSMVLSHGRDQALYERAVEAGAVGVFATNMGVEELIDAVA